MKATIAAGWCQKLAEMYLNRSETFCSAYLESAVALENAVLPLAPTHRVLRNAETTDWDLLKASLLLADLTSILPAGGSALSMLMVKSASAFREALPETVRVYKSQVADAALHDGVPILTVGYAISQDDHVKRFLNEAATFTQAGRLLIRPRPIVIYPKREKLPEGGTEWQVLDAEPNVGTRHWDAVPDEQPSPTSIVLGDMERDEKEKSVLKIAVPFLSGISFDLLSKICTDEEDLISATRKALGKVVSTRLTDLEVRQLVEDEVNPSVDQLNDRFRRLVNQHSLRTGGVILGAAALSLAAVATGGMVAAAGSALAGSGLLLQRYGEFRKEADELRRDPYYLLWRLSHSR